MYDLRFRVVRFRISGGCYETVYTNLDSETFPIGKIKELYRLRWGIETSFRELKYAIGLSCLHGKKTDFLLQEVFARLILYNYASLIARKIPVPQEKQINFTTLQIYNHYNTIRDEQNRRKEQPANRQMGIERV